MTNVQNQLKHDQYAEVQRYREASRHSRIGEAAEKVDRVM